MIVFQTRIIPFIPDHCLMMFMCDLHKRGDVNTVLPILEIEHLLLPGSTPLKTFKLFNHSVMANYSANSTLI